MSIIVSENATGERGKQDARRHRDKQRDAIRNRLPEIISEESIITGNRKGKTVKIPIRSIDIPHFRPGSKGSGVGVGQGPEKEGDVIGRKKGKGGVGGAGQDPGYDYVETEIDIEEIIEMMLEDLGLPRLREKQIREIIVDLGFKIKGRQKSGPWALIDRRATAKEGMKRFWTLLRFLQTESGRDELVCYSALKKANGIVADALETLKDENFKSNQIKVKPFAVFTSDDLRFRKIKKDSSHFSNAVMIAMMDVSGSMTTFKKYLARSTLFWLVEFLRKIYSRVEIRFIIHHAEAKLVDEDSFFKTGESGGTHCYAAYELANHLIDTKYNTDCWNVYGFHFSDGEDFHPARTVEEVKKMLAKGVNMVGYGEIVPDSITFGTSDLLSALANGLGLKNLKLKNDGLEIVSGEKNVPFLGMTIRTREHVWLAIKEFLKKDRWVANE